MKTSLENALPRRLLLLGLQIALGFIFIYGGASKILDLSSFADSIWNYRLLPDVLIHPFAIWLPWLELLAGAAVLTGFFRRGGALLLALLLGIFTITVALSMARGIDITCGCSIPLSLSTRVGFGKFIENVVLLGSAILVFLLSARTRAENSPEQIKSSEQVNFHEILPTDRESNNGHGRK